MTRLFPAHLLFMLCVIVVVVGQSVESLRSLNNSSTSNPDQQDPIVAPLAEQEDETDLSRPQLELEDVSLPPTQQEVSLSDEELEAERKTNFNFDEAELVSEEEPEFNYDNIGIYEAAAEAAVEDTSDWMSDS